MKKLVSAAMALCMIATMAVTAFAEDVKTTLSLGADSNGVNITDTLNPNTEYKFPLMIAIGEEEAVNFTEEHMEDNKFSVSITKGGSAIETPKVEKDDSDDNYYVVVKTKANYSAKNTDISFKLRYLVKASSKEIANLVVESVVGFNKMSDASIDALTKGEYLVVDPANPLITAKQFEKLAKLNDYKSVTMSYGDWRFTVNVSNMSDANIDVYKRQEDLRYHRLFPPGGGHRGGAHPGHLRHAQGQTDRKLYHRPVRLMTGRNMRCETDWTRSFGS